MKAKDLKNSILQMAVQGKLVPQDPSDEPASALLERIRAERAKLIKEKKIKAPKGGESVIYLGSDGSRYEKRVDAKGRESEPVCIDNEIPFGVPEDWEWVRFSQAVPIQYGFAADSQLFRNDAPIRLIRIRDVNSGDLVHTAIAYAGSYEPQYLVQFGDDLISMDGEFKCRRWRGPDALLNQRVCRLDYLQDTLLPDFVSMAINWYLAELWKITSKTTVKHLSAKALDNMLFAVPPLDEQRRIAGRVSELIPLVEEYGKLEDGREALDAALPERLHKSVLQMAVEGKLAPPDPSDEPASVLLERIRAERAKLIKERRIKTPKGGESVIYLGSDGRRYEKRGKGEPVCIDDEIPFDIPKGWEWARFENVLYNRDAERIPVSVAEREKLEKRYDYYGASGVIDKVDKYLFDKPLLLIGEDGANLLARTKPIAFMARGQYWVNNHAHVLDGLSEVLLEYIALFINSISLAPYVTGTAQPKMNQAKMNSILIPLPPEEEQARILKRAAELKVLVTNQ